VEIPRVEAGTKPRHATTKLTPPSSYSDATATETSRRRGVPGRCQHAELATLVWPGGRTPEWSGGSAALSSASRSQESGEPTRRQGWRAVALLRGHFQHAGSTCLFTYREERAEMKAATEKRIEPSTKSSSPGR